ncbi:MAG: HD domain-containing protein [bacterium]|nr:HD domain-containing protein [bacterium]
MSFSFLHTISQSRLARQIEFLLEIDKLKAIWRRTYLTDGKRRENTAEHSWHVALYALVLGECADDPRVSTGRVIKMLLLHDLVEVYAGDTFVYDVQACADQPQRENAAAQLLFDMLPTDQGLELRALWEEFEAGETADAIFARGLDRIQPILQNIASGGRSWRENEITLDQVDGKCDPIRRASAALAEMIATLLEDAAERGVLPRSTTI